MLYDGIKLQKPQIYSFLIEHIKYTLETITLVYFAGSALPQAIIISIINITSFGYIYNASPIDNLLQKIYIYCVNIAFLCISNFTLVAVILEKIGSSPGTVLVTTWTTLYTMYILTCFSLGLPFILSLIELMKNIKDWIHRHSLVRVSDISAIKDIDNSVKESNKAKDNLTIDDNSMSKDNFAFDNKE